MKAIRYELDTYGCCKTNCPYGQKDASGILPVGSILCNGCHYFVSKDNEYVECAYDEKNGTHTREISEDLYNKLEYLGIIDNSGVRGRNFGSSDYNEHTITVWSIWLDYPNLSEFEKMMIKYILREKDSDPKELDLKKVIHYAEERLRQLEVLKKQNK